MLQLFRRLRRHPKIQSVFFFAHNPPICGVARQNPLNRLRLWNSRRQPRVISSKQAPIAAPAQPPDTVRTAGCCEQEKRRFRRHPFILLSRRFLAAFSPRRPKSLDFDHFQRFPAFAASGRSRSFRCASSPHKTFVLRGPHFWAAAVYLCCTFPQIALGGRYPLSLPCGARTFLMRGLSALRPRLSDPVAHVLYFICRKKSNRLQFLSHADIIQAGIFSERL